jgi:L-alanine-DL-glutamate epimerase-like enolase superfamily enzyme
VHLLTAVPNAQVVEYVPRSAALLQAMPEISDGALVVPPGGGFGLELNRDAVQRYTV